MQKAFEFYAMAEDGVIRIPERYAGEEPAIFRVIAVPFEDEDEKLAARQRALVKLTKAIDKINSGGFDEETLESFARWDQGEFGNAVFDDKSDEKARGAFPYFAVDTSGYIFDREEANAR